MDANTVLRLEDYPAGHLFAAGLGVSTVLPDIDFETYSEAGFVWNGTKWKAPPGAAKKGLSAVGDAAYSEHPTTEVLSLSYDLKDGRGRRRWKPGDSLPVDLFGHIRQGGLLEAWNSSFERLIWDNVCAPRMGWPPMPHAQWRCAMAKSRAFAAPGALGKAADVLGVTAKLDGKRLINLFSIPRNPTKSDLRTRIRPEEAPVEAQQLYDYNEGDIITEAALSARIPDLQPEEQQWWQLDQTINARGVQIDMESVRAAIIILRAALSRGNAELADLTNGVVAKASEIQRLAGWLGGMGVAMASLDEESVAEALLRDDMPSSARRALEIRAMIGSASVRKLFAIDNQVCADGRLRGLYLFHGARTGRVTGAGVQPTNLPGSAPDVNLCSACNRHFGLSKPVCPWCLTRKQPVRTAWNPRAVEDALLVISAACLETLEQYFDSALPTIAGCLRGLFIAAPGHELISSDFMAIEAVVLAELAGEEWRREVFRGDGLIYERSAARETGISLEEILRYRQENGSHHPLRKQFKVMELACGFGGWVGSMIAFGAAEFMSEEEMKTAVIAWRNASPGVVELWGGQTRRGTWTKELFGIEGCAVSAVLNPGTPYTIAACTYVMKDDALYCTLPSGRPLTYHRPRLRPSERRRGELTLSFEGWNSNPKYGAIGWVRMNTYGAKMAENCIAEGTRVLTDSGWRPIECVSSKDMVHDGVDFVPCGGRLFKSVQTCLSIDGVWMTPDHLVLAEIEGDNAQGGRCRPHRPEIRNADGCFQRKNQWKKALMDLSMRLRAVLRKTTGAYYQGCKSGAYRKLWLFDKQVYRTKKYETRDDATSGLRRMAFHERPLSFANASGLAQLWRAGNYGLSGMAELFRVLLGGYGRRVSVGINVRETPKQPRVLQRELLLGDIARPGQQQAFQHVDNDAPGQNDGSPGFESVWNRADHYSVPSAEWMAAESIAGRPEFPEQRRRVYDILNAGPRNRFVVRGNQGPFVVHNCTQAISRDIQRHALLAHERAGYSIVLHTYDENVAEVPEGWGSVEDFERIMSDMPAWARNCPVRAAGGWRGQRYRKD